MLSRATRGATFAAVVFLLVQVGALALVPTFHARGYQQVQNPQDPANSVVYLGLILLMTALMLAAFRFDLDWVVRGVVILTGALLSWYVLVVFLPATAAVGLAGLVAVALYVHPEWYVIDAAGVLMGAGAAGLFGISFGLLPAILLLSVLAVYDAISVYGTEHMLDLAEGVMDLHIPVVLVIPLTLGFSLLDELPEEGPTEAGGEGTGADATAQPNGGELPRQVDAESPHREGTEGPATADAETEPTSDEESFAEQGDIEERDAFFIGLGDAVMPAVLVASAAHFAPVDALGWALVPALNLPAFGAMLGTFAGLAVLLRMVFRGRAHAGLPLLNGGAILGYLVAAVVAGLPLTTALGL